MKLDADDAVSVLVPDRHLIVTVPDEPPVSPAGDIGLLDEDRASASLVSREALHRRLLGGADIASTSLALMVALNVFWSRETRRRVREPSIPLAMRIAV